MISSILINLIDEFLGKISRITTSRSSILDYIFKLATKFPGIICRIISKSALINVLKTERFITLVVFLFIVSITVSPESTIQVSNVASSSFNTIGINERQFGVTIFSFSNIFLIVLLGYVIYQHIRERRAVATGSFEMFLFIFLLISLTSCFLSINIEASMVWFLKLIYGLVIYFTFSRLKLTPSYIKAIWVSIIVTIILETLLVFGQFFTGGLVGFGIESEHKIVLKRVMYVLERTPYFRVVGTFSHPNLLGAYITLLLPVIFVLIFRKNIRVKFASFISLCFITLILYLTLSRSSLITGVIGVILTFVMLITQLKEVRQVSFTVLKLCLIIFSFFSLILFTNPFISNRFLNSSSEETTFQTRIELHKESLYAIAQNPLLGVGPGAFPLFLERNDITDLQISNRYLYGVHNFFLGLATETGLFGLLFFVLFMIFVIRFYYQNIYKLDGIKKILAIGFFCSILLFLINGLIEPRSFSDRVGFLFWLMLGLLINLLSRRQLTSSLIS